MSDRSQSVESPKQSTGATASMPILGEAIMRSTICLALALVTLGGVSAAKELPEAPSAVLEAEAYVVEAPLPTPAPKASEKKTDVNITFVSLALVSTGSTFADSYTTLFARQNWLAGKKGVCNMEVESAYLYGTHPTVGRTYAVASVKSATSVFAAYYLRKHHNKFWSLP